MKLNNKGITLVELVVSIGLISIIILFLFRLLVDLRYSNNNTDFNRIDQQTRAVILKTIQKDFIERKIIKIEDLTNGENLVLQFTYSDNSSAKLQVSKKSITYILGNDKETWELKEENAEFGIHCVKFSNNLTSEEELFFLQITIPVVMKSKPKNSIDDLEFFYIGVREDLVMEEIPDKIVLGDYHGNTCG